MMRLHHLVLMLFQLHILTALTHHKLRHKHWTLKDRQVNEIRQAFDAYRSVARRPINAPDGNKRYHQIDTTNKRNNDDDAIVSPSMTNHDHLMVRHKRVHHAPSSTSTSTSTSTTISSVIKYDDPNVKDYDEEYDDDDDDGNSQRVNDDGDIEMRNHRETLQQHHQQHHQPEGESLTDHKMKTLGTREGVERSFQQELQLRQRQSHEKVLENIRRTKLDGACRWPSKRVIDMPQHPSKVYTPRKYVIYRCGDDTACCGSSDKTCVAKRTEELQYWFYVRHMNLTKPEMLKVRNDTECQCVARSSINSHMQRMSTTLRPPVTVTPCRCPSHFESSRDDDGACECNCRLIECRQRAEGREGFNLSDQRCINYKDCIQPNCLHGSYQSSIGRCPDRNEKMSRAFARHG